jgi:hypothetical protein
MINKIKEIFEWAKSDVPNVGDMPYTEGYVDGLRMAKEAVLDILGDVEEPLNEEEPKLSLKIEGFETREQAEAFVSWYTGQGEQDAIFWFDARVNEGNLDVNFMPVDSKQTFPLKFENNEAKVVLEMCKPDFDEE